MLKKIIAPTVAVLSLFFYVVTSHGSGIADEELQKLVARFNRDNIKELEVFLAAKIIKIRKKRDCAGNTRMNTLLHRLKKKCTDRRDVKFNQVLVISLFHYWPESYKEPMSKLINTPDKLLKFCGGDQKETIKIQVKLEKLYRLKFPPKNDRIQQLKNSK